MATNQDHTFVVTVSGCTPEQAQQVMLERICYDEDYGFDYTITHKDDTRPKIRTCKCAAGDLELTQADGSTQLYVKAPAGYAHGDQVIVKPRTSNDITLDAESVKAEMQDRFDNGADPDLTEDDLNTVLAADDERIEQLIQNFVDDSFWQAYDDVRSRVISQLLVEAP